MNKKLDFLWIDDEPKRIRAARSFEMAKNVKVTFEDVRTKDLFMELKRILNETEPDLILIDQILSTFKFTGSEPVSCTKEAKLCPDGTSVGRTGPNCEFAPCPN